MVPLAVLLVSPSLSCAATGRARSRRPAGIHLANRINVPTVCLPLSTERLLLFWNFPQRLMPALIFFVYGTTKLVPFQSSGFSFRLSHLFDSGVGAQFFIQGRTKLVALAFL